MPINIIDYSNANEGEKGEPLEYLSKSEWELPIQIEALEKWLIMHKNKFNKGSYIADIGYIPREGACGGGVITTEAMKIMVSLGMELYLSEYPNSEDE